MGIGYIKKFDNFPIVRIRYVFISERTIIVTFWWKTYGNVAVSMMYLNVPKSYDGLGNLCKYCNSRWLIHSKENIKKKRLVRNRTRSRRTKCEESSICKRHVLRLGVHRAPCLFRCLYHGAKRSVAWVWLTAVSSRHTLTSNIIVKDSVSCVWSLETRAAIQWKKRRKVNLSMWAEIRSKDLQSVNKT